MGGDKTSAAQGHGIRRSERPSWFRAALRWSAIFFFSLMLPLLLEECSYDETLNKILPKGESAYAQERLEDLRNKRFHVVRAALSPDVVTPDIEARLAHAASFFPTGDPIRIKPIGANIHRSGGITA